MARPIEKPRAREAVSMRHLNFRTDGHPRRLGNGAYAEVVEASVPCAAKILHAVLDDPRFTRNRDRFERECRILCECFHPNIVRFFDVSAHPITGRTALLMELMSESLTEFLDVRYKDSDALPYCLQLNISHDIASGVKYLHSKSILHRDLSSNNVLMKCGDDFIAKISDFGMSVFNDRRQKQLTECPGTAAYMPPEAFHARPTSTQYEKMDSFQMGVLMLQVVTKKFPSPTERTVAIPNPNSPTGYSYDPIPEKKRREEHLQILRDTEHPLLDHPILDCLEDREEKRPTSSDIYDQLRVLMTDRRYLQSCEVTEVVPRTNDGDTRPVGDESTGDSTRNETILRLQEGNRQLREQLQQEGEKIKQYEALERENVMLQRQVEELRIQLSGKVERVFQLERENQRLQRDAQTNENEKLQLIHTNGDLLQIKQQQEERVFSLTEQLRIANTNMEHQSRDQINKMRRETEQLDATISTLRQQLREKCNELERVIPNHTCRIVSKYKTSITANHPASMNIELLDADYNPRNISPNTPLRALLIPSNHGYDSVECEVTPLEKCFNVSYEVSLPGRYQLCVKLSNRDVYKGVWLCVYPDPRQPHGLVPKRYGQNDYKRPLNATINQKRELFVCEYNGGCVSFYNIDKPDEMKRYLDGPFNKPTSVAVDDVGDIFVTSHHKLQKFSGEGNVLVKSVGEKEGEGGDEFNSPSSVVVFNNEVFVCDQKNGRIQVFDLNLNYLRTIVSEHQQLFNDPSDLTFDDQGRMYVSEYSSNRILAVTVDGRCLQVIREAQNFKPASIHIVNEYLYASDFTQQRVTVFHISGKHITSFGRHGQNEGEWLDPKGITSYEGRIYVCGSEDGCIYTFN